MESVLEGSCPLVLPSSMREVSGSRKQLIPVCDSNCWKIGEKTGIYTIFVTNGAHIAVIGELLLNLLVENRPCLLRCFASSAGGFLAQKRGWYWDFYMPAIVDAVSLVVAIFFLPETLFSRNPHFLADRKHERSLLELLFNFRGNLIPHRHLLPADFVTSLYMLKYPSVALPFWYYTWSWAFINILPALTMAKIYSTMYHFRSGAIGLCIGIPLIIGSVLGELSAGKLSDIIMYRLAKRNNGIRKPEHRLYLTTISTFIGPAGMIIFGVCLQKRTRYMYPLIGLGIGK